MSADSRRKEESTEREAKSLGVENIRDENVHEISSPHQGHSVGTDCGMQSNTITQRNLSVLPSLICLVV